MAYSEAEVLAGGLAHIPVLIAIFLVFNNVSKSRSRNRSQANEQQSAGDYSKGIEVEAKLEAGTDRLKSQAILKGQEEKDSAARVKAQAEVDALVKAEAERLEAEAKLKAEAERLEAEAKLKAEAERLEAETKLKAEAERLEAEAKAQSRNSQENVNSNNEFEERLKAEANRLEFEAELAEQKQPVDSLSKGNSFTDFFKGLTVWQLGALAVLVIGGVSLFLSENSKNPSQENIESSIEILER